MLTRPPVKAEIRAVTYVGDHNLMKVNTSDWTDAGPAHPKPEWRKGDAQARPVSYTKGQTAVFDLELSATRDAGPAEDADLVGKASFGPMSFTGRGPVGRDAKPVPMKGAAVGDRVRALEGSIQFTATPARNGAGYGAGTSGGHKIYVTLDTPVTVAGSREAGITEKRMEAAVRLVGAAGTNDPHAIVSYLMRQFRFYTLRPDPAVPARYQHPAYFNEVGGAWPMAEYLGKSGECQAIVRFVRAAIKQVGCPGQADLVVCWADPDVGGGAKGLESTVPPGGGLSGKSKTVGGKIWYACLVDTYPDEGKIYDIEQLNAHYMGLNNFEACLRFEHGGTKRYYGGGAGSYQSSDEVLLAFYALAWVTFGHTAPTGSAGARVEKVVKRWRDASGKLL
ncbi:MAG: hypothetical protein HY744_22775 [Deltaproteobacteria bacterium]|nr:hypothetical protein [Deltaproteobacteria bacterium]